MSRFLLVNMNDHKNEESEWNSMQCSQLQCVCCLEKDKNFVRLAHCTHFNVLQDLIKFKVELECSYICYLCHGILKNISSFQKQVHASYLYLTDVNQLNSSSDVNVTQRSRLKQHTLAPIIISNENKNVGYSDPLDTIIKCDVENGWRHDSMIIIGNQSVSKDVKQEDQLTEDKEDLRNWDDDDTKNVSVQLKSSPYNSDAADVTFMVELEEVCDRDRRLKRVKKKQHNLQKKLRKKQKSNKIPISLDVDKAIDGLNCPICDLVLPSAEEFKEHYKQHLSTEINNTGKRNKNSTANNVECEKGPKLYKCDVCDKISSTKDAHRYHRSSHRSRVECGECDKTFSHRAAMLNHAQGVHKTKAVFKCTACDKVFKWKTSLKKHMESHVKKAIMGRTKKKQTREEKLIKKRLAEKNRMERIKSDPQRYEEFKAKDRERYYKKKDNKKGHHPPAATCIPCAVSFKSVCSFRRHMKNSLAHTTKDKLKFICDHCDRRYVNKTKLRDHIEEKHLHRTYQCPICLKPSKNRVCLDQHVRNLHRGRPRDKVCHHCGKGFPTNIQLESHIRSHTGERPFVCQYCPSTFSHQSNLYKHNRQVHMNIKAKRCATSRKTKELDRVSADQQMAPPVTHMFDNKHVAIPLLEYAEGKPFMI